VIWHCCLGGRKGIWPVKKMGGWWRWALVSPDGVALSRMVCVSASVDLPLHHQVQKFSSGTGSPVWFRKKGRKTVVVWCGIAWCTAWYILWCLSDIRLSVCLSVCYKLIMYDSLLMSKILEKLYWSHSQCWRQIHIRYNNVQLSTCNLPYLWHDTRKVIVTTEGE